MFASIATWILISFGILLLLILIIITILPFNTPTSGTIVDKYIEDEISWINHVPVRAGEMRWMMPAYYYDDKDWVLVIEDEKGRKGYIYVDEQVWEQYEVGDYYSVDDDDVRVDKVETRTSIQNNSAK